MRDDLNRRQGGMSTGLWAGIAAAIVLALVFMWAPWGNHRTADNSGSGATVGSTTRPATTASPTGTTPAAPASR
jgi:hypothetical protein